MVSKILFNWLPTNVRLFSWTPPRHPHPYCLICEISEESNDHVFQCGHHTSRAAQIKSLETIRAWGKKMKIYPIMMSNLLQYINAWMRQKPFDRTRRFLEHNPIHKRLTKAIGEQNEIGWGRALRGRLSKEWGAIQALVDKAEKRSPRPGMMVNLICKLLEEMNKMWKVRNGVQHGVTKEERRKRANDRVLPLVRTAYRTQHLDISLYKMSLFR